MRFRPRWLRQLATAVQAASMDDMDPPAVVPAAAEKQPSTARAALTLLAAVISTALLSLVFVLPALASNDAHIITMVIASVLVNLAGTALFILKVRGKKWVLQAIVIYDVLLCAIIIGSVWGIYLPVFARFQSGRISVSRVSALRNHPSASAVEFSAGAKISLGQVGSAESSYTVRNAEIVSCYVVAPIGDAANPSRADALAACAARGRCGSGHRRATADAAHFPTRRFARARVRSVCAPYLIDDPSRIERPHRSHHLQLCRSGARNVRRRTQGSVRHPTTAWGARHRRGCHAPAFPHVA